MAYVAAASALMSAFGAARQGQAQKAALNYDATQMGIQKAQALAQGVQSEDQVRQNSRQQLGKEIAAFGAAGVGYGGSSADSLRQSAVDQEMDALRTRYKAKLAGYGYGQQETIDRAEAGQAGTNGALLAGAALLKGLGPYYTTTSNPISNSGGAGIRADNGLQNWSQNWA